MMRGLVSGFKKSPIAYILVILALAGAAWWWFGKGPGAGGPGMAGFAIPVEAIETKTEELIDTVNAVGTLIADEAVVIRPEVSGRVVSIPFAEGAPVQKGEVLVQFDDSVARAEFAQAQANVELSQKNQRRATTLTKTGATSERVLDESTANMRLSRANVDLAKARLDKTRIVAPFDGIVGLRKVSVGEYVKEGQEIVNFQRIDPMKVDFAIPETMAKVLTDGQEIEINVDAVPDRAFRGHVFALDPQVDVNGRSIMLRARVPNPDGILKSGYFARVGLIVNRFDNAIMIPEEAVMPGSQGKSVYIVDGEIAKMTPVKLGMRRNGKVQVTEGLQAGQVVVTAGHLKIRDGAKVMPMIAGKAPPGAPAAPAAAKEKPPEPKVEEAQPEPVTEEAPAEPAEPADAVAPEANIEPATPLETNPAEVTPLQEGEGRDVKVFSLPKEERVMEEEPVKAAE